MKALAQALSRSAAHKYPKCPDCAKSSMLPYRCDNSVIFKCSQCHGLWLTGKNLGVFRNALKRFDFSELEIYIHPIDENVYSIPACGRCGLVLEEFEYAYNSGVRVFRCSRCQGMWMPLRGMVTMMNSLKIGQAIEEDVRALLGEIRKMHETTQRLTWFRDIMRALTTRI